MSKILTISSAITFAIASFFSPDFKSEAKAETANYVSTTEANTTVAESYLEVAAALYEKLELDALGLAPQVLEYALKGHEQLVKKGVVRNGDILTIADFSQSSHNKRLYVIDIKNARVLQNTLVAHGRNTGMEFATNFSNRHESHQSSLGFYVTRNTYIGKHGVSLRLDGLEKGVNDQALARAVVIHGADYIGEHRKGSFQGRSFGCPAVPTNQSNKLINTIKDGTALFIYHPSKNYLNTSNFLNS